MQPRLAPSVLDIPSRVYVPNSGSGTVSVIDPATYEVVDEYHVGRMLHHVIPSHDMQTLYVLDTAAGDIVRQIPTGAAPHGVAVFPQPGRYSLGHTGVFR